MFPIGFRGGLALAVRSPLHLAIPVVHQGFRIAVIAARRDVLAPNPRIERVIAPFNLAVLTYGSALYLNVGSLMSMTRKSSLSL